MTTSQTTFRVDFISELAAYDNTFGWYDKTTGLGGILFADVDQDGKKAPLVAGQSYVTFSVETSAVGNIEFFLIPDGYTLNRNDKDDLTGAIKVIRLTDGTWAVADVDACGNVVTEHKQIDLLAGQGANALFTETSKNAGGVDYASSVAGSNQTAATLAARYGGWRDRFDRLGRPGGRPKSKRLLQQARRCGLQRRRFPRVHRRSDRQYAGGDRRSADP